MLKIDEKLKKIVVDKSIKEGLFSKPKKNAESSNSNYPSNYYVVITKEGTKYNYTKLSPKRSKIEVENAIEFSKNRAPKGVEYLIVTYEEAKKLVGSEFKGWNESYLLKSKSKNIKESKDIDPIIWKAIGRHFEYTIPEKAAEIVEGLADRALAQDSVEDTYEAVVKAIDEGLFYTADIWEINALYDECELSDNAYNRLVEDLVQIVDTIQSGALDESLKLTEKLDFKYIKALKDKLAACYTIQDLEEVGADLTNMDEVAIDRVLAGDATESDIEKMFGHYAFVDDDFHDLTESGVLTNDDAEMYLARAMHKMYIDGYEFDEIADVLGCDYETVDKLIGPSSYDEQLTEATKKLEANSNKSNTNYVVAIDYEDGDQLYDCCLLGWNNHEDWFDDSTYGEEIIARNGTIKKNEFGLINISRSVTVYASEDKHGVEIEAKDGTKEGYDCTICKIEKDSEGNWTLIPDSYNEPSELNNETDENLTESAETSLYDLEVEAFIEAKDCFYSDIDDLNPEKDGFPYQYTGTLNKIINKLNKIARKADFNFIYIYENNSGELVFCAETEDAADFGTPFLRSNSIIKDSEPFMKELSTNSKLDKKYVITNSSNPSVSDEVFYNIDLNNFEITDLRSATKYDTLGDARFYANLVLSSSDLHRINIVNANTLEEVDSLDYYVDYEDENDYPGYFNAE